MHVALKKLWKLIELLVRSKKMKVLCTICARGGSKGVKNKNLLKINNKSLIEVTYDISKKINYILKHLFHQIPKTIISC